MGMAPLTLVYASNMAEQHAVEQQVSTYYGPMNVQNVTIEQVETVQRYGWYYYRVFEAKVVLEVSWECDTATEGTAKADTAIPSVGESQEWPWTNQLSCESVKMYYDPCQQGHLCHRYLRESLTSLRSLDVENRTIASSNNTQTTSNTNTTNTPAIGDCDERENTDTVQEAQKCIDNYLTVMDSSKKTKEQYPGTTTAEILLYGSCGDCTAYAAIPVVLPRYHRRLLYNGIFFMVMGLFSLVTWFQLRKRFRRKFMPAPPSGGRQRQRQPPQRPRRRQNRQSNDPVLNRIHNQNRRDHNGNDLPGPDANTVRIRTTTANDDDNDTVVGSVLSTMDD
jgi:hypothetical protein